MLEFKNIESLDERIKVYKTNPSELYQEFFWDRRSRSHRNEMYKLGKIFAKSFNIMSLADFGCGVGGFIHGAKDLGVDVIGLELVDDMARKYALDQIKDDIYYGNAGNEIYLSKKYDCCSSIEVAEHLLPEQTDTFVKNLTENSSRLIVITTSEHPGYYHFCCQPKEWWEKKFVKLGWTRNYMYEKQLFLLWQNTTSKYLAKNLMIFTQKNKK